MKLSRRNKVCIAILLAGFTFAHAQQSPNASLVPAAIIKEAEPARDWIAPGPALTDADREGHNRIFVVVPAFGVTDRQDAPPLTAKQKFAIASRQALDPFVWASTAVQAGMSQAGNEFPEYGQGTAGYSKRYGAAMLDVISGGFSATAFSVLLKQDPRYFRLGTGSIERRALYSIAQQFSAKNDRGERRFNWSNLLGTFASSAISNAYYPRSNRGVGLTLNRASVSLLWGFTGELTDEFGPDVSRKLFHRKPKN